MFLFAEERLEHGTSRDEHVLVSIETCRLLGVRLTDLQAHVGTDSIAQHVSVAFDDRLVDLPPAAR